MADTITPKQGFTLPEVGSSKNTWGDKLNTNWEKVDALLATDPSGSFLPLAGGTMTGDLVLGPVGGFAATVEFVDLSGSYARFLYGGTLSLILADDADNVLANYQFIPDTGDTNNDTVLTGKRGDDRYLRIDGGNFMEGPIDIKIDTPIRFGVEDTDTTFIAGISSSDLGGGEVGFFVGNPAFDRQFMEGVWEFLDVAKFQKGANVTDTNSQLLKMYRPDADAGNQYAGVVFRHYASSNSNFVVHGVDNTGSPTNVMARFDPVEANLPDGKSLVIRDTGDVRYQQLRSSPNTDDTNDFNTFSDGATVNNSASSIPANAPFTDNTARWATISNIQAANTGLQIAVAGSGNGPNLGKLYFRSKEFGGTFAVWKEVVTADAASLGSLALQLDGSSQMRGPIKCKVGENMANPQLTFGELNSGLRAPFESNGYYLDVVVNGVQAGRFDKQGAAFADSQYTVINREKGDYRYLQLAVGGTVAGDTAFSAAVTVDGAIDFTRDGNLNNPNIVFSQYNYGINTNTSHIRFAKDAIVYGEIQLGNDTAPSTANTIMTRKWGDDRYATKALVDLLVTKGTISQGEADALTYG